jgi:hypothetical protein
MARTPAFTDAIDIWAYYLLFGRQNKVIPVVTTGETCIEYPVVITEHVDKFICSRFLEKRPFILDLYKTKAKTDWDGWERSFMKLVAREFKEWLEKNPMPEFIQPYEEIRIPQEKDEEK